MHPVPGIVHAVSVSALSVSHNARRVSVEKRGWRMGNVAKFPHFYDVSLEFQSHIIRRNMREEQSYTRGT